MSTPEKDDFRFDLSASSPGRNYAVPLAVFVAVVGIVFIILTMTTNIAARLLPMNDNYLQAMIPPAPDGAEPLALTTLDHEILDKTITVRGSVTNRTDQTMLDLRAVFEIQDTTGRFGQSIEVPLDPADLLPQGTANFQTTATLQEKPGAYSLKFRFLDGPFVPHRDDRPATYGITTK